MGKYPWNNIWNISNRAPTYLRWKPQPQSQTSGFVWLSLSAYIFYSWKESHLQYLRARTRRLHSVQKHLIKNSNPKRRLQYGISIGEVQPKPCWLPGRNKGHGATVLHTKLTAPEPGIARAPELIFYRSYTWNNLRTLFFFFVRRLRTLLLD